MRVQDFNTCFGPMREDKTGFLQLPGREWGAGRAIHPLLQRCCPALKRRAELHGCSSASRRDVPSPFPSPEVMW